MPDCLPKENLTQSTFFGLIWQYVSVFVQALLQLLVLGILARLLSPEDFGLVGMALIFVGLVALFSQLGIGPALIQRSSLTPEHMRVGFSLSVLMGVAMLLILRISAPLIARFFRSNELTTILYGVSFNFLFASFGTVSEALLQRSLQFKKLASINVAAYIVGYACIGIALAWVGWGMWALVGAILGQTLVKSVLLLVSHPHPMAPLLTRQESRDLLYFGGGFTLARIFNYAANQGDYLVIGRVLGPRALGVYTRAYQIMMLPATYFGQVLNTVLFPAMAKIQNETQRLRKIYLAGIATISLVGAPVSVLMVALAPDIVEVILGSNWLDTIIPFRILALGVLPRVSYKIDDSLARALGVMYRRSVRDAIYVVAVVLGSWIGLRWGLPGAAVGVLFAIMLNDILAIKMSLGLLDCSLFEFSRAQAPGLFLAVVVALVTIPTRSLLHGKEVPSLFILAIITAMNVMTIAGLLLLCPRILGVYGTNALSMVLRSMPRRLVPRLFSDR